MSIKDLIGQEVKLKGVAKNAKGCAVLVTDNKEVVYVRDLLEWSDDILNKRITVQGELKESKLILDPQIDEDGAISQGAYGMQLVLENLKIL